MKLSYISSVGIRAGKTTAICEAAAKIGATVLCHSADEAKRVAKEYKVETIHLGQFPLLGSHKPILVDTHAMAMYAVQMECEVSSLSKKLAETEKALNEVTQDFAVFKKAKNEQK